jgi:16S rRNA (cytidine1402-2'-O)-methyltransferase
MAGTLYIVATPIGNLEDITQRALRVLREVDVIACEDTRHTKKLLNHFGIETRSVSYHEHNEQQRAGELRALLESGENVALVSDAGTPLISDPGFRLVHAAIAAGIEVVAIPGPVAFVNALVVSGLPSDQVLFAGFLPARAGARRAKLEALREVRATLIFYEAPHRIAATLKDAAEVLGDRPAAVARELTKLHEQVARGTLSHLAAIFSKQTARGEMVLMIGSAGPSDGGPRVGVPDQLIERVGELEAGGLTAKEALKKAARELGMKRAEAYRTILSKKGRLSDDEST